MNPIILRRFISSSLLAVAMLEFAPAQVGQTLSGSRPRVSLVPAILGPAEAARLLPDSLFLRGHLLPTEPRNSGGIRFSNGMYLLAALVDTSGHVSMLEGFEACFISEVPLYMSGHKLSPGEYGLGEDDRHRLIVMDIAARSIFVADAARDLKLFHPRPLQILAGSSTDHYRLYLGREYVALSRAGRSTN